MPFAATWIIQRKINTVWCHSYVESKAQQASEYNNQENTNTEKQTSDSQCGEEQEEAGG